MAFFEAHESVEVLRSYSPDIRSITSRFNRGSRGLDSERDCVAPRQRLGAILQTALFGLAIPHPRHSGSRQDRRPASARRWRMAFADGLDASSPADAVHRGHRFWDDDGTNAGNAWPRLPDVFHRPRKRAVLQNPR